MRTHKDKLQALLSYLSINVSITSHRLMAEKAYDMDDETWSWHCLFLWAEDKNDRAKLTNQQADQIRKMNMSHSKIAFMFGVSATTIGRIKREESY